MTHRTRFCGCVPYSALKVADIRQEYAVVDAPNTPIGGNSNDAAALTADGGDQDMGAVVAAADGGSAAGKDASSDECLNR